MKVEMWKVHATLQSALDGNVAIWTPPNVEFQQVLDGLSQHERKKVEDHLLREIEKARLIERQDAQEQIHRSQEQIHRSQEQIHRSQEQIHLRDQQILLRDQQIKELKEELVQDKLKSPEKNQNQKAACEDEQDDSSLGTSRGPADKMPAAKRAKRGPTKRKKEQQGEEQQAEEQQGEEQQAEEQQGEEQQ
ncbi:rho GTPase-activating protein gacV-like isoform X3 [Entelurus aequoreus]|uniref:rho GTPase-activating protein gacV-like isoform X3 n=1 Tax=Entelurus aequoreus TaxID=161455 RepID=UPI002B1E6852|nr:rho GTPase-activating protein gacV-like isoform X3 [Entelurus aequoreus]XP_061898746.1 rho GTPase-activating protein gacV-like isoform X3 [Entelurus aequoreus]